MLLFTKYLSKQVWQTALFPVQSMQLALHGSHIPEATAKPLAQSVHAVFEVHARQLSEHFYGFELMFLYR